MKSFIAYVPLAICCLTLSCSVDAPGTLTSVTKPSQSGETNVLFWQDKADLYRGNCLYKRAINRANCSDSIVKFPVADLTKRAMDIGKRGIDSVDIAIKAEIQNITKNDPTVVSFQQQISALTAQKSALQTQINEASAQLLEDRKTKGLTDDRLSRDNEQLKLVEKQLRSNPTDEALLDQQRQLKLEIASDTGYEKSVVERIQYLEKLMKNRQTLLTKVTAEAKAKQDDLTKYMAELDVYSPRLEQLKADKVSAQAKFSALPKVLAAIANGDVTYRGTIWPTDMQDALTMVERSFGGVYLLTPGRYKMESGQGTYCPQSVRITPEAKIFMTFLSPCSATATIECENENCKGNVGVAITMTILDATHYEFSTSSKAVFAWQGESL